MRRVRSWLWNLIATCAMYLELPRTVQDWLADRCEVNCIGNDRDEPTF